MTYIVSYDLCLFISPTNVVIDVNIIGKRQKFLDLLKLFSKKIKLNVDLFSEFIDILVKYSRVVKYDYRIQKSY